MLLLHGGGNPIRLTNARGSPLSVARRYNKGGKAKDLIVRYMDSVVNATIVWLLRFNIPLDVIYYIMEYFIPVFKYFKRELPLFYYMLE